MPQNNIAPGCDAEVIHRDVVDRIAAKEPPYGDFLNLANLYKNFADPTRVRILWALSRESLCVCDIAFLLGMTKSAVSHQLKLLRLSNLVRFEKIGKEVHYSLADEHVESILDKGVEHIHE